MATADANIFVIIDGSGSMSGVKHDVVDGINEFISEQQTDAQQSGDTVKFWLTTFDDQVMEIYQGEDLSLVTPVSLKDTYLGGSTALLDAIGKTLTNAENDVAPRNIVVIYTDGGENASREFKKDQVGDMLEKFTKTGKWQIIYLGSEFADFQNDTQGFAAVSRGAKHTHSINTTKGNVTGAFATVSKTTNYLRNASVEDYDAVAEERLFSPLTLSKMDVDLSDVEAPTVEPTKVKEPTK